MIGKPKSGRDHAECRGDCETGDRAIGDERCCCEDIAGRQGRDDRRNARKQNQHRVQRSDHDAEHQSREDPEEKAAVMAADDDQREVGAQCHDVGDRQIDVSAPRRHDRHLTERNEDQKRTRNGDAGKATETQLAGNRGKKPPQDQDAQQRPDPAIASGPIRHFR
jgi:hypothetical protein